MRVALFVTCLGDRFHAAAVADAVRLLRSLGVDVDFPKDQTCCGQPAWNAGHRPQARRMAEQMIRVFSNADYVVAPSGSCTAMVRHSYPLLHEDTAPDGGPNRSRPDESDLSAARDARDLAGRAYELAQFIVDVLGVHDLGRGLEGTRVAYHHGCHALRELGIEAQPVQLLVSAGAQVVEWEMDRECCGFGGFFSVKNPEVSVAMADRKLDSLPDVDAVVSADGGCLMHLGGRADRLGPQAGRKGRFRHLASVLWEARRGYE